jgi:hypothetical protein
MTQPDSGRAGRRATLRGDLGALAAVAAVLATGHLLSISRYGVFRDELYYVACGERLAWGYVDHPPLVAVMAWVGMHVFGGSVAGLRLLPVALAIATLFLTGAIVRRLGGGRFAQVLAATAFAVAPHYLFIFHILSMNASEVFLWALAAWLLIRALDGQRLAWIAFGAACGLGLMNKISMLVFGAGLAVGLLLTPARRWLATPWPWGAAAVAGLMCLPHVLWQHAHGWPTAEFIRNAQQFKIADSTPAAFFGAQVLSMHPLNVPLVLAGLWWLFTSPRRHEWAAFRWAAAAVTAILLAQRSKAYYLTPIYTILFAAGSVQAEGWLRRPGARAGVLALLAIAGAAVAPMALPVLPVERLAAYQASLGLTAPTEEKHELGELPQHFADMHGWEDLAREVSRVYLTLPEGERPTARVFASNYGQAGAIEYFAGRYPLPRVISPHNNYWYWGPGPDDGGAFILIGGTLDEHLRVFERVEQAGVTRCRYCMPYENGRPIFVGGGWKVRASDLWPRLKRFI